MDIYRLVIIVASITPPTTIVIVTITTSITMITNTMKIAFLKTAMNNPPILTLMVGFLTLGPILVTKNGLGNDKSCRIAIVSKIKTRKYKKNQYNSSKRKKKLIKHRKDKKMNKRTRKHKKSNKTRETNKKI